jgi:hypothetical protein
VVHDKLWNEVWEMFDPLDYHTPKPASRRRLPVWAKWTLATIVLILLLVGGYVVVWLYIVTYYHPEWL